MPRSHSPLEVYVAALKNAHALCAEAEGVYRRQADHADDYPAIAERLRTQSQAVAAQKARLERALEAQGEAPSAFKDAVTSAVGAAAEFGHGLTGDAVIKDFFVAASFAGLSHVAFRSLKTSAELAGQAQHDADIDESIRECEDFGRWLYEHVDPLTRDYTARVGRGDEAQPT